MMPDEEELKRIRRLLNESRMEKKERVKGFEHLAAVLFPTKKYNF